MKKLLTNSFMLGMLFTANVSSGEPTIKQTVDWINKTLQDPEITSETLVSAQDRRYRAEFLLSNKCKVKTSQRYKAWGVDGKEDWYDIINVDFSQTDASYDYSTYPGRIRLKDWEGLDRIISSRNDLRRPNDSYSSKSSWESIRVGVNGIYKEKLNKALKHLSKTCQKQYGSKKKDLF